VLVRRLRTDLPVESMQGWMMVVGAPLLHAGSLLFREPQVGSIDWTADAVVALVYLTPVVGGVGFLLYLKLLDRIGPVEVNLISYTLPVSAAAVGWVLLGERVEPNVVAGFLVIVVGFVLVKRRAIRDELGR
jgi:drug/metabolite transporter (DMT)-like permease